MLISLFDCTCQLLVGCANPLVGMHHDNILLDCSCLNNVIIAQLVLKKNKECGNKQDCQNTILGYFIPEDNHITQSTVYSLCASNEKIHVGVSFFDHFLKNFHQFQPILFVIQE